MHIADMYRDTKYKIFPMQASTQTQGTSPADCMDYYTLLCNSHLEYCAPSKRLVSLLFLLLLQPPSHYTSFQKQWEQRLIILGSGACMKLMGYLVKMCTHERVLMHKWQPISLTLPGTLNLGLSVSSFGAPLWDLWYINSVYLSCHKFRYTAPSQAYTYQQLEKLDSWMGSLPLSCTHAHSLTHSLTNLLTHSLTRLLTCSLTH